MKELRAAEAFYESLAGVRLRLIPPRILGLCPNLLHSNEKVMVNEQLIAPNLCKVSSSEEVICFCGDSLQKPEEKSVRVTARKIDSSKGAKSNS